MDRRRVVKISVTPASNPPPLFFAKKEFAFSPAAPETLRTGIGLGE
jgi:hypothetical protein